MPTSPVGSRSVVLACCRLLRLPNVFSAVADVLLGYWIVQPTSGTADSHPLLLLIASSGCLYLAGMVFNDLFDLEVDRHERPERPLPSETLSYHFALVLAVTLSILGVGSALAAGFWPAIIALLLVGMILAYDSVLKHTVLGPFAMGGCRGLNVLLGMSPALASLADANLSSGVHPALWLVPLANGLYIVGVTWFARQEASTSSRTVLGFGALGMAAGLATHAVTWLLVAGNNTVVASLINDASPDGIHAHAWPAGALFVVLLARPVARALQEPAPRNVQLAVKAALMGLIVLDAVAVLAFRGAAHGLLVIALLVPALFLGRWIYST